MKRRTRTVRHGRTCVELTDRDREVLLLIGQTRYVGADQIAREVFPSDDRARRRLRTLFDAGLLRVVLVGSRRPNVLALTREGLRVVLDAHPDLGGRIHMAGTIPLGGVAHHLATIDVRLYLAALARQQGGRLLRWSSGSGDLAKEWGCSRTGIEPDGLAEVELPGEVVRLGIEVDTGTETLRVIEGKLRRYADRGPDIAELWLVADGGERRRRGIGDLVLASGLGSMTRVVPRAHLCGRPAAPPPEVAAAGIGHHRPNSPDPDCGFEL